VAWTEKKLPAICLKCGAKKHIVRRKERLTAATATQGLSAVGAVCGVMVARAMREDAMAGAVVLSGAFAGSIVVGYVIHSRAPKVDLRLPLCKDCDAAWSAGVRVRHAVLAMVGLAFVAAAYGFFAHESAAYILGGALLGGVILTALVFRLPTRFVHASAIQGTRAVLKGVSDQFHQARVKRDEG
jgi:hypothetical protein